MEEPSFETVIAAIDQLLDEAQTPAEGLRLVFDTSNLNLGLLDACSVDRGHRSPKMGKLSPATVADDLAADFCAIGEALRSETARAGDLRLTEDLPDLPGWVEDTRPHDADGRAGYRGVRQPSFDAAQASLLRKLTPVLRRVMEIRRQLGKIAIQRDEARDALDALELGIAVVDHDLRITHSNIGADEILAEPDGALTLRQGRLCARHSVDQRMLKRRIDEALQSIGDPLAIHQTSLILRGSERAHSLAACIMPTAPSCAGSHPKVMVALRRLDVATDTAACARQMFDLTDTEAKFASALASGSSLAEAAEAQGVRISTARTHLARIFQKTDTRQQSQLVSLLQSAALPLRLR